MRLQVLPFHAGGHPCIPGAFTLSGSYRIESPGLGRLSVGFCTLVPPGEPDQALYLFTPEHEGPPRAVWAAAVARRAGRG
ncbi:hypothetical protein ABT063_16825 [Streptomyces sp. NPDC002838]|uniref:hypothetical protein n=1 Tax=Streptomyces sp. NPDC002838 TaxID=3154436 RepID=UPI003322584F